MDLKSCFTDCCMACSSLGSNYRTSKIQGQGDCKDSIKFQEHEINWKKGKNLGKKFGLEDRFGYKEEKHKKQLSKFCNCFSKNNTAEDFLDKIKHETEYEKKNFEFFQNCTTPWNSSYANWTNNEIKESTVIEKDVENQHSNSEKLVAETLSELKGKVEFLLKNFKNYNQKIFNNCNNEISQGDYIGIVPKDVYHMYDISKRLSVAEKNIQKLTLILQDLLSNLEKRRAIIGNKMPIFSESLSFEEMPITQRINLLKSRNDYLFEFMKDFLQVRSVEELCSALDTVPKNYESDQNPQNPTNCFVEGNKSYNFNRENVTETLKDLRSQASEEEITTLQNYNEDYPNKHGKKGESATKCFRNKLEVISEQAELAFYYDSEYKNSSECRNKSNEYLKVKVDVKKEDTEKDNEIYKKTAKLFAQEAMLKSSLDKADLEIFSNRASSESKKNSPNLSIETPTERDTETSLDSSGVFWEADSTKNFKPKDIRKCPSQKKEIKQGRNKEPGSSNLSKKSANFSNKINKLSDCRNLSCKLWTQKNYKPLSPLGRSKGNVGCLPEICSYSREENKKELKSKIQRPMSTPGSLGRTLKTSEAIGSVPEKNRKKISGINNVRNKNKILLSQKSCV